MKNHCVFYRTNLNFDGRVCSIIRTLAQSFPDDEILLYEFTEQEVSFIGFPSNVFIVKPNLLCNKFKRSFILQLLKNLEYAIRSFLFLLKTKPKTIQVHHEVAILGPLIYKILYKNTIVVYDDKEMYHLRDKNIPKILYWLEYYLIRLSDLIIITNLYRRRALQNIHKNKIKKSIIVDNYVFEPNKRDVSTKLISQINKLKKNNNKILLHQGVLSNNRRNDLLNKLVNYLPKDWVLGFIGINDQMYIDFTNSVESKLKSKLHNFGFVDYSELDSFYYYVDASVIFYDSKTFNNKYCAPNRLYSAVNKGKPILVNKDNATLNNFINMFGNGLSFTNEDEINIFFEYFEEYSKKARALNGKYEFNSNIHQLYIYYSQIV